MKHILFLYVLLVFSFIWQLLFLDRSAEKTKQQQQNNKNSKTNKEVNDCVVLYLDLEDLRVNPEDKKETRKSY